MKLTSSLCCAWLVLGVMLQEITAEVCVDIAPNCAELLSNSVQNYTCGGFNGLCEKTCGFCKVEPTTDTTTTTGPVTTVVPDCTPKCDFGHCNSNGKCSCYQGYEGDACDQIVCPEDGFFKVPNSTNQCFKSYRSTSRGYTWFQAKQLCEDNMLVLAQPRDPVATRRFLLETYGNGYDWINARGSGSIVRWGDGQSIPNNSSLWDSGEPGKQVTSSYCMKLRSWTGYLDKGPLKMFYCKNQREKHYALCELPQLNINTAQNFQRENLI